MPYNMHYLTQVFNFKIKKKKKSKWSIIIYILLKMKRIHFTIIILFSKINNI